MLEAVVASLLAACAGFVFGRLRATARAPRPPPLSREVHGRVLGLTPGETPDLGIDYLLADVPVTPQSLHIHLAVASLARERGETQEAIRIHTHVLAHAGAPVDPTRAGPDVRMELVRDFLAAGLLDRAELLLMDMINSGAPAAQRAEEHLLEVYQRERDWQRAVELGRRLVAAGNEQVRRYLAHFLCELAEERSARRSEVERLYREALETDPTCVRALLALAGKQVGDGLFEMASATYADALQNDPRFAAEALAGMRRCHIALGSLSAHADWLAERQAHGDLAALATERARVLRTLHREDEALQVLRTELAVRPAARVFRELMDLEDTVGSAAPPHSLRAYAEACVDDRQAYQCENCGFSAHMLLWSCPSCQRWSSVLPADSLQLESA